MYIQCLFVVKFPRFHFRPLEFRDSFFGFSFSFSWPYRRVEREELRVAHPLALSFFSSLLFYRHPTTPTQIQIREVCRPCCPQIYDHVSVRHYGVYSAWLGMHPLRLHNHSWIHCRYH